MKKGKTASRKPPDQRSPSRGKTPAGSSVSGSSHKKLPFPHGTPVKSGTPLPRNAADPEKTEADYYRLKLKAVDDLVSATPENSPPVPVSELRKYHAGPKVKVADWIKAILLKWWMGGVVCYFLVWGLSTLSMNPWDHLLILGIVMGMATNLITNNIFRFIAKTPGAYDRWMMFPGKSIWFLPPDLLYASLLVTCTVMTYGGLNLLLAGGAENAPAAVGVEPILFGAVLTLWDLLFLGCKRLLRRIFADARQKAGPKRDPS